MIPLIAIQLVRLSAWSISRAYLSGQVNGHKGRERAWGLLGRLVFIRLLRVAILLDAEAATTQMINEGWWG